MSTTIKSKYNALWDIERLDDALVRIDPNGDSGDRVFKTADFLDALRAEGVLTDDGLRERVEAILAEWDAGKPMVIAGRLRDILNPPKPFQFPTGLGAVLTSASARSAFVLNRNGWIDEGGCHWTVDELRQSYGADLEKHSDGVSL